MANEAHKEPTMEEILASIRKIISDDAAAPASAPEPEPALQPVPEPVAAAPAPAQPKPAPAPAPVEKPMSASPAYDNASLTDESTANAAAGALGKLISKMDLGTDNTLEGLVRELLRPMIKEWLDANLASIVEQKVEAEVERISRMAR
ncbi:MAG: DUF2497 domain-containing protein [Hyphomonas sp.]|nr:DUF2497 domain-containing protein [Hyphomonas sp.]